MTKTPPPPHSRNASRTTRRRFLGATLAAAAAPLVVPGRVLGKDGGVPPSERIGMGFIGVGGRGGHHTRTFLGFPEVQVQAVCDPQRAKCLELKKHVEDHYGRDQGTYKGCGVYQDFRELLARDDIDAVAIASPEYWHGIQGAMAAAAGKDVYGEKALTLTVAEGRALVDGVRRYGRVFQVGTQQRSMRNFRFACELARNGYLGRVHRVEVGVPGGRALPEAPPAPVPDGLDYEMWLGPAPYTPYNELKCTFNWYFIYDYCVGWIQSWGVHHCDIAQWGAPSLTQGRVEVEGTATFPAAGLADTSVTWRTQVHAANGVVLSFSDNTHHKQGCRFEGDKGWVHVNRSGIWAEPASLLEAAVKPSEEHLYLSNNHWSNFLECVRTRRDPAAPVEAGHRATTLTLVADIATRLGRRLTWDWDAERFVNDDDANQWLSRSMRSPWRI